jgi:hypothetical protein
MLTNIRKVLYRQQPKSADLLIGTISILFAWASFLTRNIAQNSPTVIALERIAPLMFWIVLLIVYGFTINLATTFNRPLGVVVGSGLGTFTWGAISGILFFNLPLNPRLLLGIAIYIVFFIFCAWSFINSQEVLRLTRKFGPNYHRVVEEEMLKELMDLRERVHRATTQTNEAHAAQIERNHGQHVG